MNKPHKIKKGSVQYLEYRGSDVARCHTPAMAAIICSVRSFPGTRVPK